MSTRAHIRIFGNDYEVCKFYRHHDGYPSVTGQELQEVAEFCGWNINRIVITLLQYVGNHYELTDEIHGDEAYCYQVSCRAKKVTCFEHEWDDGWEATLLKNRKVEINDEN